MSALTSQRDAGGMCDGCRSASTTRSCTRRRTPRRENFTLLHEFAHLLVEDDEPALIWLADRDDPDVELERLCEDIAAALLIPAALLDLLIHPGPVTGQHVLELYKS